MAQAAKKETPPPAADKSKSLRFTGDFRHVKPTRTVRYKAGDVVESPTAELRQAAVSAGKAEDGAGL